MHTTWGVLLGHTHALMFWRVAVISGRNASTNQKLAMAMATDKENVYVAFGEGKSARDTIRGRIYCREGDGPSYHTYTALTLTRSFEILPATSSLPR